MKIPPSKPLADPDEDAARNAIVLALESDPEYYLAEYLRLFGNVLNADSAATLFAQYNADPAKYRVAVHPAAQWIRDELFRRALEEPSHRKNHRRVVFTAGGNAAGKSTAVAMASLHEQTLVVFDSTLSNSTHARQLVGSTLRADKTVAVVYVNRALEDALRGMIERADTEGRVVTIDQLIKSQRGAAITVRELWDEFRDDPRFTFTFFYNSANAPSSETGIESVVPRDYTESRGILDELLNTAWKARRITDAGYNRIRGSGSKPRESSSRAN